MFSRRFFLGLQTEVVRPLGVREYTSRDNDIWCALSELCYNHSSIAWLFSSIRIYALYLASAATFRCADDGSELAEAASISHEKSASMR